MKFIIIPFLSYVLLFSTIASAETITIVADDWCPYNCKPESQSPGYIVEIAREIFHAAGHELDYKYIPWARALREVTKGTYNGAIAATHKEMPTGIFPDEELGRYGNSFIIRKGNTWHFNSMDSLKTIRLGTIKGYNYGNTMNEYIKRGSHGAAVQILTGNNAVERNLKKLLQDKIDVYLEDINVANYTAAKMGITDKIAYGGTEGKPIPLYIGFSPADPDSGKHAEIFSRGISNLRKSGRLSEILNKYGVSDWK